MYFRFLKEGGKPEYTVLSIRPGLFRPIFLAVFSPFSLTRVRCVIGCPCSRAETRSQSKSSPIPACQPITHLQCDPHVRAVSRGAAEIYLTSFDALTSPSRFGVLPQKLSPLRRLAVCSTLLCRAWLPGVLTRSSSEQNTLHSMRGEGGPAGGGAAHAHAHHHQAQPPSEFANLFQPGDDQFFNLVFDFGDAVGDAPAAPAAAGLQSLHPGSTSSQQQQQQQQLQRLQQLQQHHVHASSRGWSPQRWTVDAESFQTHDSTEAESGNLDDGSKNDEAGTTTTVRSDDANSPMCSAAGCGELAQKSRRK